MTLAQLRARFRLDPSLTSITVIPVADADILLNEGALDMNRKAGILRVSGTFNTVIDQQTYILSGASPVLTNFMDIDWETGGLIYTQSSGVVKTQPNHFKVVSESWLDLHRPGWQTATASDTPDSVYLSYNSAGGLVLGQHPKPSTTTPSWKVYFISRGVDMAAAGDYPWVPATQLTHLEPFHKGIVYYALWQTHLLKTFRDKEAQKYLELYVDQVEQAKAAMDKLMGAEIIGTRREAQVFSGQSFGGRR